MTRSHHLKMTGCRRAPQIRTSVIFPCSPSVLLSFCLALIYLFSLARGSQGVALGGGPGEIVEPLPQGEEEETGGKPSAVSSSPTASIRGKRSRDYQQQLCGYRLLDALRNVCDRNFVGYTRRSDPGFGNSNDGTDGQSGEDILVPFGNMNSWDLALLTVEYPHSAGGAGDVLVIPSNPNRDSSSILDYLEPQQPDGAPRMVASSYFPWSSTSANGISPNVGGGITSPIGRTSSKAIALKMLTEQPKTHQRFRRNIIDECCKKPCAMNQMLKYCATAVGKRSY